MADYLHLKNGTVYDPTNQVSGKKQDLWVHDGKIVALPSLSKTDSVRALDLAGMVVMPGGIDMHCHIAGPKVNTARKMRPEEKRGLVQETPIRLTEPDSWTKMGTMGSVPSTYTTGYKYAGMGYTSAFDAAIPPLTARHTHEEFADTPCIDKGFFLLVGNNHFVMEAVRDQDPKRLESFLAWLIGSAKGFAPKLVNPGGVEVWKQKPSGNVSYLDQVIDGFDVTARQIVQSVTRAANSLGLPHPVHIHSNQLGVPGNWKITLETMESLENQIGHLTHIQFHSYGGDASEPESICSKVAPLADYINDHPNLSVDVGQVMFGETTSMTGDGPLGYFLHNIYGTKWFSGDTELESGCGIAPIKYRNKSLVHALQWAIGLEWFLMVKDPWQVLMSTDHPNGGSFLAYPQIIALLMDSELRKETLKQVHADVKERTQLAELQREYTLEEICIITRSGPAKRLGLVNKGHLGIGADADITVYSPQKDKRAMFELPRYVFKSGHAVIEDGELRRAPFGKTLVVEPEYDRDYSTMIDNWFNEHYTIRVRNYPIADSFVPDRELINCRNTS